MTIMSNSFWRIALTSALHSVIICATCGRERGELDQPPWPLDFDSGLLTSLTFSLSLRVINLNISVRSLGSTVRRGRIVTVNVMCLFPSPPVPSPSSAIPLAGFIDVHIIGRRRGRI
jgi:hypothetical protein